MYQLSDQTPFRVILKWPKENLSEIDFVKEAKEDDTFQINVDVHQFRPKEVMIKILRDRQLVIECEHEKKDEQSAISRYYVKKIYFPKEYDVSKISSTLSSDGLLIISAPKLKTEATTVRERAIPINQINKSAEEYINGQLKHKL